MEHNTAGLTLVNLVTSYIKEHNLPYEIVLDKDARGDSPQYGLKPHSRIPGRSPQDDWIGWIYDTEFKSYDWAVNRTTGVIKHISAHDPEFFLKLEAWLPECEAELRRRP